MFEVKREEIDVIYGKSHQVSKETRWYIFKDGEKVLFDSKGVFNASGIFFYKKKDAMDEIDRLSKTDDSLTFIFELMKENEEFKKLVNNLLVLNTDLLCNPAKTITLANLAKKEYL